MICNKLYFKSIVARVLLIVICYCASLFSRWVNVDVLIVMCIFLFVLLTLYYNLRFTIKYSGMIVPAFLAVLGTYVIEHNSLWLVELKKGSHYAGSLPLLVGYYLTFLVSLELFDKYFFSRKIKRAKLSVSLNRIACLDLFLTIFGILFFIITLSMFIRVAIRPFFLVHMDRFSYQETYITGVWKKLADYYYYFIPLLLMNIHRKKCHKLAIVTIVLYVLYLFMQGEKYGGYITVLLYYLIYFIPMIPSIFQDRIKKVFKGIILVFAMAFGVVLFQYTLLSSTNPLEHFYQRIAQQGQLWWSIYDSQVGKAPNITEFSDELDAYTDNENNPRPYYSIYKMMYLSAPERVVTDKIATGATYTESSAASLYYYFGSVSLPIFAIIMGWFFALLAYKYVDYIRRRCFVESMVVARLFFLGRSFFSMSRFTWLFDKKTAVSIGVLVLFIFLRHFLVSALNAVQDNRLIIMPTTE